MGERSVIEWTDSTWNPWRGCDKVSPGCAHCYMFRDQRRYGRDPEVVVRAADATFYAPLRKAAWARERDAAIAERGSHFVFTCSWSDWFHPVADDWRREAWEIIRRTPQSTYQILTKRPELIAERLPEDWGDGYPNVWLGVTIENRRFVDRADLLRGVPAAVRFISAEPLLGPLVYLTDIGYFNEGHENDGKAVAGDPYTPCWEDGATEPADLDLKGIDWLIVGGESGPGHRRIDPNWVRDLLAVTRCDVGCDEGDYRGGRECLSCSGTGRGDTAFLFKQWGGPRPDANGRLLDGRTYDEFPTPKERTHA